MKSAARKERRQKVVDMVYLLLNTETRGMQVSDIATLIDKAFPYRMSVQRLSMLMSNHIQEGNIEVATVDRRRFWRLPYEPVGNPNNHGMETRCQRNGRFS